MAEIGLQHKPQMWAGNSQKDFSMFYISFVTYICT